METAQTLVSSYCFPPFSDTAGVVAAKRVREAGVPVDVVTNSMDGLRDRDPSLTGIAGRLVMRYAAVAATPHFASWKSVRAFVHSGGRIVERWESEQGPYRKIYSRAHFISSHFLAATRKIARPGVSWTAEFSDPLSHDSLGRARVSPMREDDLVGQLRQAVRATGHSAPGSSNAHEWCEAVTFALADTLVFTNRIQRDFMLDRCHDQSLAESALRRSVVQPHPTLPREFYERGSSTYPLDARRVNIGYFGNFYANRGVGLLFEALAGLPPEVADRLVLHVFTNNPDELSAAAASAGVAACFRINPYVDYLEFLALADRMDLLLLNDAVAPPGQPNPFLPSKWSDYTGSSTPVWAIVQEGSTLDALGGFALRTPVEHTSALQQALARLSVHGAPARRAAAGDAA